MSKRSDNLLLEDILETIESILVYTHNNLKIVEK
jgi:uncharacterized protein with HEPN domain